MRMPRGHLVWAIGGTILISYLIFVIYKQSCDAEALRQREMLAQQLGHEPLQSCCMDMKSTIHLIALFAVLEFATNLYYTIIAFRY